MARPQRGPSNSAHPERYRPRANFTTFADLLLVVAPELVNFSVVHGAYSIERAATTSIPRPFQFSMSRAPRATGAGTERA